MRKVPFEGHFRTIIDQFHPPDSPDDAPSYFFTLTFVQYVQLPVHYIFNGIMSLYGTQ